MNEVSRWRGIFHPNVTLPLIVIIAYLFFIAAANLIAIYHNLFVEPDLNASIISMLAVIRHAIPAYGLTKLKRWARWTELALSVLSVILGILLMLAGQLGLGVLIIVPSGLIAIYLLSNGCRRAFGLIT